MVFHAADWRILNELLTQWGVMFFFLFFLSFFRVDASFPIPRGTLCRNSEIERVQGKRDKTSALDLH